MQERAPGLCRLDKDFKVCSPGLQLGYNRGKTFLDKYLLHKGKMKEDMVAKPKVNEAKTSIEQFRIEQKSIRSLITHNLKSNVTNSVLNRLYKRICNVIEGGFGRILPLSVNECLKLDYIAPRFDNTKTMISAENKLKNILNDVPEINAKDVLTITDYLRRLLYVLISLKSAYAIKLVHFEERGGRKGKKNVEILRKQLEKIDRISQSYHQLSSTLKNYHYFQVYITYLIKSNYNKVYIEKFLTEILDNEIGDIFNVKGIENLKLESFEILNLLSAKFVVRLQLYDACRKYVMFQNMLKNIPGMLLKQYYVGIHSAATDPKITISDIVKSGVFKQKANDVIKSRMMEFKELFDIFHSKVIQLLKLDRNLHRSLQTFPNKIIKNSKNKAELIERLNRLKRAINVLLTKRYLILNYPVRGKNQNENSLSILEEDIMEFYGKLVKDFLTPSTIKELAEKYGKRLKLLQIDRLTETEKKYLDMIRVKRNTKEDYEKLRLPHLLRNNTAYMECIIDGIVALILGHDEENIIIRKVARQIKKENEALSDEEATKTALAMMLKTLNAETILNYTTVTRLIPLDKKRFSNPLGRFILSLFKKYLTQLESDYNYPDAPNGTDREIIRNNKSIVRKVNKMFFEMLTQRNEAGEKPMFLIENMERNELTELETINSQEKIIVTQEIDNLIAYWKKETDFAVVDLSAREKKEYILTSSYRKLSKNESTTLAQNITKQQFDEITKHLNILFEIYEPIFKEGNFPYFEQELMLLYLTRQRIFQYEKQTFYQNLVTRINFLDNKIGSYIESLQ